MSTYDGIYLSGTVDTEFYFDSPPVICRSGTQFSGIADTTLYFDRINNTPRSASLFSNIADHILYLDSYLAAPANLTASHDYSTGYTTVQWPTVAAATDYRVYYSNTVGVTTASSYFTSSIATASHIAQGTQSYYYKAVAYDSVNYITSSLSAEISYTLQVPSTATNVIAYNTLSPINQITWTGSYAHVTSYRVYYSNSPGVTTSDNFITTEDTSFEQTVSANIPTYYRILTLDSTNILTSSLSTEVSCTYVVNLTPAYYFYALNKNNPKGWSRDQGVYGLYPANVESRFVIKSHYWLGLYSGFSSTNDSGQDVPGSNGSPRNVKLKPTGIVKSRLKIGGRNVDLRRKRVPNAINYDDRFKDNFGNPVYNSVSGS